MYEKLIKPILFSFDPESAHDLVVAGLSLASAFPGAEALAAANFSYSDPSLKISIFGRECANPVGLAAGFDKNAKLTQILPAFGFGFIEVGTITKLAQPGNPKPRLLRIPDSDALINRLGFNNRGADAVKQQLIKAGSEKVMLGINIGKSKATRPEDTIADYVYSFEQLYEHADYFAVNVSSPNTPGLRDLQKNLTPLLSALQSKNQELSVSSKLAPRPILVKIAPDLDLNAIDTVLECCMTLRISGIIATNTTVNHTGVNLKEPVEGGLSGRPLFRPSTEVLRRLRQQSRGQLVLFGVGGVFSAEDAYAKIKAGASLVQLYTAWVYQGPTLIRSINEGLSRLLKQDGLSRIQDAVGVEA